MKLKTASRVAAGGLVALFAIAVLMRALPQASDAEASTETYHVVRHILRGSANGEVQIEEQSRLISNFEVNGNLWASGSVPVEVRYNSTGEPPGLSGTRAIIGESIGAWNAVSPATFTFEYREETSLHPGGCDSEIHLDGTNTIQFAPIEGDTLALTCTVFLGNGAGATLVEFDMLLSNTADRWASATSTPTDRFDLQSTVLHELGHAAGLGHSGEPGSVMFWTLSAGEQRRAVDAYGFAGLQAAYPVRP